MILIFVLIVLFLVSCFMTKKVRDYAESKLMIDLPNERSSHVLPTPRGGGIAVVVTSLLALLFLSIANEYSLPLVLGVLTAGICVAAIGFVDDLGHVSVKYRLPIHFISAFIIIYLFEGLPAIKVLGNSIEFGMVGNLLSLVAIVWLLNLFNFMDGIDGIAGIEVLCVTATIGGIAFYLYDSVFLAQFCLVMFSATLGFLVWNFPSAKIFLGDVGSGFLGLMLGAVTLLAANVDQALMWSCLIMLGVFIVDSTYTLIRRLFKGEKIYEAHRCHAYQNAALRFGQHKLVSTSVGVINLVWLMPIALTVCLGWVDGLVGVMISYLPLVFLAKYFNAGEHISDVTWLEE